MMVAESAGDKGPLGRQLEDGGHGEQSKSQVQAAKPPQKGRGRGGGKREVPGRSGAAPAASAEAGKPEEHVPEFFVLQPPGHEWCQVLRSRPEMFWTVLREPQKMVLAGYSSEPFLWVSPTYQETLETHHHPLEARVVVSRMEWPWLERAQPE